MKKILTGILCCCIMLITGAKAQQTPLPATPQGVRPLLIGDRLPSSTVSGTDGAQTDIREITGGRKTVLVFYRGGWCPYCNKHLADLATVEKDLVTAGYQVVAVSPDRPENLRATETKVKTAYRLYSDSRGGLIRAMGIAYKAPANYMNTIKEASGGVNTDMLPVPSVFLLDAKGVILFSYVNPDFKQRINGDLLLAAAKILQ